jgi:AAA family ATP:ADP antiporter
MKSYLLRILDVEHQELGRVGLLLIMSFFMGVFLATLSVASQSLFLEHFDEKSDLPVALLVSGTFGLFATILYNVLQNRIPFQVLAVSSLLCVTGLTAFIEFGEGAFDNPNTIFFLGFTTIIPFSFILFLVFWGSFSRMFNIRQSKRLVGTVDLGAMVASFVAFFSIPQFLEGIEFLNLNGIHTETLYTVSLTSVVLFLLTFLYLSVRHLNKGRTFAEEKVMYHKLGIKDFFQNRYLFYMALFIIVSMIAINFVDYSFLNVTNIRYQNEPQSLARFIALFEGTVVIFGFLFQIVATDRITKEYGMRVSLLVNPLLIALFTVTALILGSIFGYTPEANLFIFFFLIIAVSKLFIRSLKDSLDNPTFKLYLLPIESNIRIDVQTKIEGIVTALASVIAGGLIILINRVEIFDLLFITIFTIPLFGAWYFAANRLHTSYQHTLQDTLLRNKQKATKRAEKEYTVSTVLEKEINSTVEEKVVYALKLMEKLEPALFENAVTRLTDSSSRTLRTFALSKIQTLGLQQDNQKSETRALAERAYGDLEDSDLLSISPEKLLRLSKSVKQADRILAAKLLRKLIGPKTIFILLELLRDADPKVRYEALFTARKVKRTETWPVLIELLGSPTYSHHAAAALKEAGEPVLATLEAAFHKSGQNDLVMLRIVQIMGRIGGRFALQLLWKKTDYPDKRIVKQILFSLRFINYHAEGKEARDVINLLEAEMSKTIWNLAALDELPDVPHFYFLREALQEEVVDNYDQISMLLSILYDPQSVQLVRDNIESGDPDNIAFAMELLDLFIEPELKPKLVPLLDDISIQEKLKLLQIHFPRESYNPVQVINYILNRDFNLNNRWTKACAIHASAYVEDFRISRGLVAQMFNSDKLLQETAAWVIYNKDKKAYEAIAERLPARDKKFLDSSIENNQLLDGLNDGFFLWIEKVMFTKQMPAFKNIHGSLLSDLADKVHPIDLEMAEKMKFSTDDEFNNPIIIVAHGEVKLKNNDQEITILRKGDVYGELFQDGPVLKVTELVATERAVVFKINLMDFYFVMANHHELVQGLIKNITEENRPNVIQP